MSSGMYVNMNTGVAQSGHVQFRNAVINGDMRINQRGTSNTWATAQAGSTGPSGTRYTVDRWAVYRGAFDVGSQTNQGIDIGTTDLPFTDAGITTYARVGRTSGNALTSTISIAYSLESQDSKRFAGQTTTLSFYYRTGANFSGTNLNLNLLTGTGTATDEPGQRGASITGGQNNAKLFAPTSTWQRGSLTVLCTTATTQLHIYINYTPTGTAGANDYFDITGVQLEKGPIATPFELRPYPIELRLCQRYFTFGNFTGSMFRIGAGGLMRCQLSEPMRTAPNLTKSYTTGPTDWTSVVDGGASTINAISSSTIVAFNLAATGNTSASYQGSPCTVFGVYLDAEL